MNIFTPEECNAKIQMNHICYNMDKVNKKLKHIKDTLDYSIVLQTKYYLTYSKMINTLTQEFLLFEDTVDMINKTLNNNIYNAELDTRITEHRRLQFNLPILENPNYVYEEVNYNEDRPIEEEEQGFMQTVNIGGIELPLL